MSKTFQFGNGEWAVGKETALAYNDENNNFKPLPFTFDRASSATVVNKDGLIETVGVDEPRIDFSNDSKGALLLEPSRSNIMPYSEDFSQWTPSSGITATSSQTNELTGKSDAYKLESNGAGGFQQLSISASTSGVNTYSVFAKKGTNNKISLRSLSGVDVRLIVNLETGVLVSSSGVLSTKIEDYGNDWYRISLTYDGSNANFYIYPFSLGTANEGFIYIYGAQVEAGSYATSYIPTQGGVETRLAESCKQTSPDGVIGQTEGTVYFETEINGLQGGDMRFQLSDGSTNNWIFISSGEATGIGVKCRAYINYGTVNQFNAYSEYLSSGKHKYAFAYKQNDIALYVDGIQVALGTSATIPTLNQITLGGSTPTSTNSSHFLKYDDLKLYNTRLSNTELQALTT